MSRTAGALCGVLVLLTACQQVPPRVTPLVPQVRYESASWRQLPGWQEDAVEQAWPALLASCAALPPPQWASVCAGAAALTPVNRGAVRAFFESSLEPLQVVREEAGARTTSGLLTGYFEPQLRGSRTHQVGFDTPLYAPPDDLLTIELGAVVPELKGRRLRGRLVGRTVVPYYTRAQLPTDPALSGHELVWVDSALDGLLLEVQGSGRVQLQDGSIIRLGYADQNGQPYVAIGRYLVNQGELTVKQATIPGIRAWLAAHPQRLSEVLNSDPAVVFFRELPLGDPALGPRGAQGVPLTPGRSIAVDPQYLPLGAPVYLAGPDATLRRVVIAQDTGGAIRSAPRADLFCGTGPAASELAGSLRAQTQFWLLWPKGLPPPQ